MLQLKKIAATAVLWLGCVGFAQATGYWIELDPTEDYFKRVPLYYTDYIADQYYIEVAPELLNKEITVHWNNTYYDHGMFISRVVGYDENDDMIFDLSGQGQSQTFILESSRYTFMAVASGFKGTGNTSWGGYDIKISFNTSPVPEPETYAMLLAGLGVVGMVARRRKLKVN